MRSSTIASIGAAIALAAFVAPAAAQDDSTCTIESVAGSYGFNFESQQGSSVFPPGGEGLPFATVGRLDLNADGTWSTVLETFIVMNGEPPQQPVYDGAEGTWEIDENCMGRLDYANVPEDVDASFISVNNGMELFIVWAFIAEADAKRISY